MGSVQDQDRKARSIRAVSRSVKSNPTTNVERENMADIQAPEKPRLTLNGQPITEDELQKKIAESQSKPGVKIVEVSKGTYKQRING